jgi:hypothetical protein
MKDGGSATKFAWDAKLGVQSKTASSVSFKFHAYIQNVIAAIGSDFYYTAGGGIISVLDYASIFQSV